MTFPRAIPREYLNICLKICFISRYFSVIVFLGTKIPENKCFCDGDCMPYGALNVSNCRHGSPAFVTLPHFYKADPFYLNAIEGIVPSHDTDNFFMVFEPVSIFEVD